MPVPLKASSGRLSTQRLSSKHPWRFLYGMMDMVFQYQLHCRQQNKVFRDCSKDFTLMKTVKVFISTPAKHGIIPAYARCMKEEFRKCVRTIFLLSFISRK